MDAKIVDSLARLRAEQRLVTDWPASEERIRVTEAQVGFRFPDDLRELYALTNGLRIFMEPNEPEYYSELVPLHRFVPENDAWHGATVGFEEAWKEWTDELLGHGDEWRNLIIGTDDLGMQSMVLAMAADEEPCYFCLRPHDAKPVWGHTLAEAWTWFDPDL